MEFKAGDVVILKSGGPIMTVASLSGEVVNCVWTEKNKTYREAFPAVVLKTYQRPRPMAVRF